MVTVKKNAVKSATSVGLPRPCGDRVMVRLCPVETSTPGGIVLPGQAQEQSREGHVVAVGPGRMLASGERAPVAVSVHDRVLVSTYAGERYGDKSENLMMVREDDIMATFPS